MVVGISTSFATMIIQRWKASETWSGKSAKKNKLEKVVVLNIIKLADDEESEDTE